MARRRSKGIVGPRLEQPDRVAGFLGAAVGLGWWVLLVVGSTPEGGGSSAFFVATGLSAALFGLLFDRTPSALAGPMGGVPFLAAWSTAPRGDGDGLWALILPMLAGWTVLLVVVTGLVQRGRRRIGWPAPGDAVLERHGRAALLVAYSLGVVALVLLAARLPNPWPDLNRRLEAYPAPAVFQEQGLERRGDPRCNESCLPELDRVMTTHLEAPAACSALEESLSRWPKTRDLVAIKPFFYVRPPDSAICAFKLLHTAGADVLRVFAQVNQRPGRRTEVRVTILSAPRLNPV